ncbi:MAG: alpha/beta hydrolase [Robiginitomaculum sp.]|nr:alpha/beta hydrolase [Robiginitomaculum sp.]
MGFPKARIIDAGEVKIAVYERGAADGPPVLLLHGWPEMAYSWKHQMGALADAGYRAIAMDLRGFGRSGAPKDVRAYRIDKLVGDIEGVLGALGIREVVLCGHDWGGIIVWHAARMLESRVRGVISVCTPHMRRPPADPIEIFKHRYGDDHYFVAFQEPDVAEAVFEQDPLAVFKMLFRSTPPGTKPTPDMFYLLKHFQNYLAAGTPKLPGQVMSDEDLQVYAGAYTHSGFHGGVNLYRNTTANYHLTANMPDDISQPSLMISTADDLFLPPEMANPMEGMIPDLERVTIESCGHWAMWEKPDEINKVVINWLTRKMGQRYF